MLSEFDVLLKQAGTHHKGFVRRRVKAENPHLAGAYAKDDVQTRSDIPLNLTVVSVQQAVEMDAANERMGIKQTPPEAMQFLIEYVHGLTIAQRGLLRTVLDDLEPYDSDLTS
jgi:predicted nucleotidyltransferase